MNIYVAYHFNGDLLSLNEIYSPMHISIYIYILFLSVKWKVLEIIVGHQSLSTAVHVISVYWSLIIIVNGWTTVLVAKTTGLYASLNSWNKLYIFRSPESLRWHFYIPVLASIFHRDKKLNIFIISSTIRPIFSIGL